MNLDQDPSARADLFVDIREIHKHLAPGSVEEALMVRSLNQLTLAEARVFFRNMKPLLIPGGRLVLETADYLDLIQTLRNEKEMDPAGYIKGIQAFHDSGSEPALGGAAAQRNRFGWTSWHLELELREAGYEDVRVLPPKHLGAMGGMRLEAILPKTGVSSGAPGWKGKILCVYDSTMGHVTCHTRGLMFREEYIRQGWDIRFLDCQKTEAWEVVRQAAESDVTYALKVASLDFYKVLKKTTKTKIVFDLTDALWNPFHQLAGWTDLDAILGHVDAIFSENEWVCAYGRKFTDRVYSIPVCLQAEKFDAIKAGLPPRDPAKLVVGWVGSTGTVKSLELVRDALDRLSRKYQNLELRILGCADPLALPSFRNVPFTVLPAYTEEVMMKEILSMDVGLFPAPFGLDDYAIRGGQKAFLYMAAGVPPVCHNAGDCGAKIRDGKSGMLVDEPEDWYTKLDLLLGDCELRRRMGLEASRQIRMGHSLEQVFSVLDKALLSVMGKA